MATRKQIEGAVDSPLAKARARAAASRAQGDLAVAAAYDSRRKRLQVELASGSAVAIPVARIEALQGARPAQIRSVMIVGGGRSLHWTGLDLDLSVPDLVAGCFGTRSWMSALARKGGQVTSEAKSEAARQNGRKGGRPRKLKGSGSEATSP